MMSISQCLQQLQNQLVGEVEFPRFEADLLVSHVLQQDKSYLYSHGEVALHASETNSIDQLLQKRLMNVPMAYVLGTAEFWSLTLDVTPDVLIPRPETELLVEWILNNYQSDRRLKVADLGTGSGAIALALASERSQWQIDAVDNSEAALLVASSNARRLGCCNIRFNLGHWCDELHESYQLIVSNPPYIEEDDPHLFEDGLSFEPQHALISPKNGMSDIETIINQSFDILGDGGVLVLEHGYKQQDKVSEMCYGRGFHKVIKHVDYNGKPRMVVVYK